MARGTWCSRLAPCLLLAALAGCEPGPRAVRWSFSFETEALRARAEVIAARVLEGGCGGERELYAVEVRPGATPAPPSRLGPGTYGLEGVARDAACVEYARGCREVALPAAEAALDVALRADAERAACGLERCALGVCRPADAGPAGDGGVPRDASCDAGPATDGGPALAVLACDGERQVVAVFADGGFDPARFELAPAGVAEWRSYDLGAHRIRLADGAVELLLSPDGGLAACVRFERPGEYAFECTLHGHAGHVSVAACR